MPDLICFFLFHSVNKTLIDFATKKAGKTCQVTPLPPKNRPPQFLERGIGKQALYDFQIRTRQHVGC